MLVDKIYVTVRELSNRFNVFKKLQHLMTPGQESPECLYAPRRNDL